MKYVLAIDQSTSGTKGTVWSQEGALIARCDLPHRQITNAQGWIEHDPDEILKNTIEVCRMATQKAGISPGDIRAVGISNQRETIAAWDKVTGKPVYNAIVWQCGRAADITERLSEHADLIRKRTGLKLSPFFSAAKYAWILKNVPLASELASQNRLCLGTIDSWLVYKLTREHAFKTDYSNASRTQLLNLDTLAWDAEIAGLFGIKPDMLPEICPSDSVFGMTDMGGLLTSPVPICAVLGDSHASLYAHGCHQPMTAKATFGTGTSVMMNVGDSRPVHMSDGVVESLAWGIDGRVSYVLEGNINYSGAIIKWMADKVNLIGSSRESGELAVSVEDTNGVYLVPAFSGLGAPYWRNDVRAIICGMNANTSRAHIVRAGLEAISYQIRDVVEELDAAVGSPLKRLCVDGGATSNEFLMHFTADQLMLPLSISRVEELSAAGVAYLALISSGCASKEDIFKRTVHDDVQPANDEQLRARRYNGWKDAVGILLK